MGFLTAVKMFPLGADVFLADRVVINVEGRSGKTTHVVEKGGVREDVGWNYFVPLGGFQPQLEEGVDGRNIVGGCRNEGETARCAVPPEHLSADTGAIQSGGRSESGYSGDGGSEDAG